MRMSRRLRHRLTLAAGLLLPCLLLAVATYSSMQPFPERLSGLQDETVKQNYMDRNGIRLNVTFENRWNTLDRARLHDLPDFLQSAFIRSEDRRFMEHGGADWQARLAALFQNIRAGRVVRGASTISEQVVRMIHPRPRTLWSRWLEGFEAAALEERFSKPEILEFYLNQVPYGGRRRGVSQAARYYFDRSIDTLSQREMLTLAVLVRSPKWFDPGRNPERLNEAIANLLARMPDADLRGGLSRQEILAQPLEIRRPVHPYNARHFIEYVDGLIRSGSHAYRGVVHTTLDAELQQQVQAVLDERLQALKRHNVNNGAVLVVDHRSNEILAWASAFAGKEDHPFNRINPVITPRQPGSALKPLLYARALEKGWTAATMLDDSPLEEGVGLGMHTYHNYSRGHYGLISLREALGNSLNIPAVRAIQHVGAEDFLLFMQGLGIESLSGHPNVYGDGIALGNGEVTLFELVQAYTVLARMGTFKPLSCLEGRHATNGSYRVLDEDVASLMADILSDPAAREKEFGWNSILNLPYQTAVKTGTSSDYRDAWSVGYNDRFTVGVWFGNLDYAEMQEITGANGPAFVLRTIFNELNKNRDVRPLYLSPQLRKQRVCIESGMAADSQCAARDEWFIAGSGPQPADRPADQQEGTIRLRKPTHGLMLAMDPRIPDEDEYFEFRTSSSDRIRKVEWFVNGMAVGESRDNAYHWKVSRGHFTVMARVWLNREKQPIETEPVEYQVN